MAYEGNIPLPRDRYRVSQGDILQNFQAIDTVTQLNHVLFNDADQGKHKFVQFPEQATEPDTGGTQIALYSEEGLTTVEQPNAVTGLVFKRSTGIAINFTDTFVNSMTFGLLSNQLFQYWNRLPSGLLIKIASFFVDVNTFNTVVPPSREVRIPVGSIFNNIYWTNITPQRDPFIDPNASNADPNVVIYITGTNATTGAISYRAWTRNLFNNARQEPKTSVLIRVVIIGD